MTDALRSHPDSLDFGQPRVVGNQVGTELLQEHHFHDELIEGVCLEAWNARVMAALGNACLRQVLVGGSGPLGPKRER